MARRRKEKGEKDPVLVEMFAKSPDTANRSYQQNVNALVADLNASFSNTKRRRKPLLSPSSALAKTPYGKLLEIMRDVPAKKIPLWPVPRSSRSAAR